MYASATVPQIMAKFYLFGEAKQVRLGSLNCLLLLLLLLLLLDVMAHCC